jgi:putative ABC transport system permease protein
MLILVALRSLLRNPRRTSAVLLTVAVGVASIFIFHGFNTGIMNQYRENSIHARYGHGQLNTKGYREQTYEKPWERWITNAAEVEQGLRALDGVQQVFPRVEFFALLTNGKITVSGRGQGVKGEEEAKFFNTLNIEQGETLSGQKDGILLGRGLANALSVKPGDRVTVLSNTVSGSINGVDLIMTGYFHTGAREMDDVIFRIQLEQAHVLLDTDRIESVALGLRGLDDWRPVAAAIEQKFPNLEAVPFEELDKVYYKHSVDWLKSQFAIIEIIILTIVLLGILNTVATAILDRKQEIGNLRANGESFGDVLKLLAWEGVALGALGALLGLALTLVIVYVLLRNGILMPPAPGITRQFHVFVELQPDMAGWTFLMGLLTASMGTVLAGWRVARMPIGQSLRSV